jgi:hypothetical protein
MSDQRDHSCNQAVTVSETSKMLVWKTLNHSQGSGLIVRNYSHLRELEGMQIEITKHLYH